MNMKFFTTLKAQHIALLITQPTDRFNGRLIGALALVIILTGVLLYGLFGDLILREVVGMFNESAEGALPLDVEQAGWLLWGVPFVDVFTEFVWIVIVAYVSMRVLKYLKRPLRFKHICNVYALTRLYEMLVAFALLLGFSVVALYTGTETLPFLQEEPGVAGVLGSFIVPVYFFWMYLWSITFVSKRMVAIDTALKKDTESKDEKTDV